jgi:ATP-dependent DNA helicase RecG
VADAPLSLRELGAIPITRVKGVGAKKAESLEAVGVTSVLDLLTTYPRRWVDRTNEARVRDLVPGTTALVLVAVRSVTKRQMRNRRSMVASAS